MLQLELPAKQQDLQGRVMPAGYNFQIASFAPGLMRGGPQGPVAQACD